MSENIQSRVEPRVHVPPQGGQLRPWVKGQSGNPGGLRNNDYAIARKICAEHSIEAINKQLELMRCDDPRVAFIATEAILNRGIGKPRDHSQEDQARSIINLDGLSDEERMLLAKLLLKTMPREQQP